MTDATRTPTTAKNSRDEEKSIMTRSADTKEGGFTPGPWERGSCEWEYANVEFAHGGSFFTILAPGRECPVAFVPEVDDAKADDNARLIAAAPDLLASLAEILDYEGGAENALADPYVMDRARAALAKALTPTEEGR